MHKTDTKVNQTATDIFNQMVNATISRQKQTINSTNTLELNNITSPEIDNSSQLTSTTGPIMVTDALGNRNTLGLGSLVEMSMDNTSVITPSTSSVSTPTTSEPGNDKVTLGNAAIVPDSYVHQVAGGVKYMPMMMSEPEDKPLPDINDNVADDFQAAPQSTHTKLNKAATDDIPVEQDVKKVMTDDRAGPRMLNFEDVRKLYLGGSEGMRRILGNPWEQSVWQRVIDRYNEMRG